MCRPGCNETKLRREWVLCTPLQRDLERLKRSVDVDPQRPNGHIGYIRAQWPSQPQVVLRVVAADDEIAVGGVGILVGRESGHEPHSMDAEATKQDAMEEAVIAD